jgi:hypothetical protein
MKMQDLIGKKIIGAKLQRPSNHDDQGFLKLNFSDGSECLIVAGYDFYTGNSSGEYPTSISIIENYSGEAGETLVDAEEQVLKS